MHASNPHPSPLRSRLGLGDGDRRVLDLGRLLLGLVVVALGLVFLLDAAGALDADRAIDRWWPLVFVAAGVLTLAERPPAVARGLVLLGAGAVLLLFTTHVLEEDAWKYVWPISLIVVGVVIVWRWPGLTVPRGVNEEDVIRSTAVFGGPKLKCTSQQFHGAWLTAVFGGIELDLREALPAAEGASVNATAAFGGIEVLVPKGWRISVRCTPIFGGVEDKTEPAGPLPDDAPALHIDAVTVFGGVEIKHGS
jgi:predicted membrane protein